MNLQEKQNLIENIVREVFYKDNNNYINKENTYYIKHHIYTECLL